MPGSKGKEARAAGTAEADRFRAFRVWTVVGGIAVFAAVLYGLGFLLPTLEFLAVGCVVGFICSPIVNWLEDRGVARPFGALVALVVIIGVVVLLAVLLGPPTFDQLVRLLRRVPDYLAEAERWLTAQVNALAANGFGGIEQNVQSLVDTLTSSGSRLATTLLGQITNGFLPNVMNFMNGLFMFFLGLILAYWLAVDYPRMFRELAVISGPRHQEDVTLFFAVLSRSVGGYMRSVVITSVIAGVLAWVGFVIVGQPYAGLMGILTAFLHVIPVIGPFISAALATVTALTVSPLCAFWTLVMAMIAENITDNLIGPVVMRSSVSIHPAFSLLAIVVGSTLGGPLGMVISIPISAAIKGVFVYYFETRTRRQIVSYEGAIFQGTPFRHPDGSPAPSFDALDDDNFFATSRLIPEDTAEIAASVAAVEPETGSAADLIRRHVEEARQIFEHPRGGGDEPAPVTVTPLPEAIQEAKAEDADAEARKGDEGKGEVDAPEARPDEADEARSAKEAEAEARRRRRRAKRDKKAQDKYDRRERKAKRLVDEPIIVAADEDDIPNDQDELKVRNRQKRERDSDGA